MKGYVCQVCGYISITGYAPEKCPVCGAAKTSFKAKEEAVKIPKDPANLTELEKKHVPLISIVKKCGLIPEGCLDVQVKIGEIKHPMEREHYILHMDFYIDKQFMARLHLTPEKLNPAVSLHLKAEQGKLAIVELCNIHGAWIKEADL